MIQKVFALTRCLLSPICPSTPLHIHTAALVSHPSQRHCSAMKSFTAVLERCSGHFPIDAAGSRIGSVADGPPQRITSASVPPAPDVYSQAKWHGMSSSLSFIAMRGSKAGRMHGIPNVKLVFLVHRAPAKAANFCTVRASSSFRTTARTQLSSGPCPPRAGAVRCLV